MNDLTKAEDFGEVNEEYIKRAIAARDYFLNGYNCSQSVAAAFIDKVGLPEDAVMKLVQPLGGGLSRLREVCGAVSGGAVVLGAVFAGEDPKDFKAKAEVYSITRRFVKRFEEFNGSYICRILLGLPEKNSDPVPEARTGEYYKKRPCAELVYIAALLTAQLIGEVERERGKSDI